MEGVLGAFCSAQTGAAPHTTLSSTVLSFPSISKENMGLREADMGLRREMDCK